MAKIPDRLDKIGIILKEMQSNSGAATEFTASEVSARYAKRYPGDVKKVEDDKSQSGCTQF